MITQTQRDDKDYYDDFYKDNDWKNYPILNRLKLIVFIKIAQSFYKKDIKTVLDAGCGKGLNTSLLNHLSYKVKGFDFSRTAVIAAQKRYPDIDFRTMNGNSLNYNEKFDFIFAKGFSPFNTRDFNNSTQIFNHWRNFLTEDGIIYAISRSNFTGTSPTGWIFLNEESINRLYGDTKLRKKIVYLFSPFWVFIYLLPKSRYITLFLSILSKYMVAKLFKIPVTVIILLQND